MNTVDSSWFCSSSRASTGRRRSRAGREDAEATGSNASRRMVASAGSTMRCTRSAMSWLMRCALSSDAAMMAWRALVLTWYTSNAVSNSMAVTTTVAIRTSKGMVIRRHHGRWPPWPAKAAPVPRSTADGGRSWGLSRRVSMRCTLGQR